MTSSLSDAWRSPGMNSEEARKLSALLSFYSSRTRIESPEGSAELKKELEWSAPHFYADVLLQAEEEDFYCIDANKLHVLQSVFNLNNGSNVDAEKLIGDGWIRMVHGVVRIPSVISEAARVTAKLADVRSELEFLVHLHKVVTKDTPMSKPEFHQYAKGYQIQHQITLDLEAAAKNHLWSETEGKIAIPDLSYYEPVVINWDALRFIHFIYEHLHLDGNQNDLCIEATKLQALINNYHDLFPQMPTILDLVEDGHFISVNNHYNVRFNRKHTQLDMSASVLWERVLDNNGFKNDADRLLFWFKRVKHRSSWSDIGKFTPGPSLSRFIDAAVEALLADTDLGVGQEEYRKLLMDPLHGGSLSSLAYYPVALAKDTFPVDEDLYELYTSLQELDGPQNDILHYQEVREPLAYMIRQVLKNEAEFRNGSSYPAVFHLLEAGKVKSFLLWNVCQDIKDTRPTLISVLLLREQTAALAFSLLWEVPIDENTHDIDAVRSELLTAGFRLLLDGLVAEHLTDERKAKIVFQAMICATKRKYRLYDEDRVNKNLPPSFHEVVLARLKAVFQSATGSGNAYIHARNPEELLFPHLLEHLFTIISQLVLTKNCRNFILELPLVKLDLLSWILKLRLSPEYKQSGFTDDLHFKITDTFVQIYTAAMNTTEMEGWDHSTDAYTKRQPLWPDQSSIVELVPWHKVLAHANHEILHSFLRPTGLSLKTAEDRYDAFNRFTANKIRTHIFVLIEAFDRLFNDTVRLKALGIKVQTILDALQTTIVTYITHHHVDEPDKRRIDLFDDLFEMNYASGKRKDLLAAVGSMMNKFTKDGKQAVMEELLKAKHLKRALKLLQYVSSEADRRLLLSTIETQDITEYLSSQHSSIDSIHFILQELAKTPELIAKAKAAQTYWRTTLVQRRDRALRVEDQLIEYRMNLLIAYHEKDETAMLNLNEPVLTNSTHPYSVSQEKDFYRALLFLESGEPIQAYDIFDQQLRISSRPRPILALNRFASKLAIASSITRLEEKYKLYQESIDEWDVFEKTLPNGTNIEFIFENVGYNKLLAFEALQADANFDAVYHTLERSMVLRVEFLELRLKNLVRRGMQTQAEQLFKDAQEHHRLSDGSVSDRVAGLATIIETQEALGKLKEQYRVILSKSAESLVAIIPEDINKFDTLPEAILYEIVYACNQMLIHVNSVSEIDQEDKYSDLLQLVLNARLSMYGWRSSLTRGGQPFSGTANLGEIDFAIFSKSVRLCLCEAMILKGKNISESQKHNFKIFNYDHERKLFFMLIYYKGRNYAGDWDKYKLDVAQVINFPVGYDMILDSLEDITADFGNDSIRVGKGIHKDNAVVYHIYLNIEYFVSTA